MLTLMLTMLTMMSAGAETPATTQDGRTVVLHDDHTWSEVSSVTPVEPRGPKSCEDLVETQVDKMTGNRTTMGKTPIIVSDDGKTGVISMVFTTSTSLIWSLRAIGASKCVDDDNKANLLFLDGSRLELENDGKFNCDESLVIYFGGPFGKRNEQAILAQRELDTIRVWTHGGFVERAFTPEQRADLRQTFACLKGGD